MFDPQDRPGQEPADESSSRPPYHANKDRVNAREPAEESSEKTSAPSPPESGLGQTAVPEAVTVAPEPAPIVAPVAEAIAAPVAEPVAEPVSENHVKIQGVEYRLLDKDEALSQLQNGDMLEGVFIQSLRLSEGMIFSKPISLKNCAVGSLELAGAQVAESIQFETVRFLKAIQFTKDCPGKMVLLWANCILEKGLELRGMEISSILSFVNSTFQSDVDCKNTHFANDLNLSRVTFEKKVSFRDCTFDKGFDLSHARCHGQVILGGNQFLGEVRAGRAELQGQFQMFNCRVEGKLDFNDIAAQARVDLEHVICKERVKASGSVYGNKLVVKECIFEKYAGWSRNKFQNDAAFSDTKFKTEVCFDGCEFLEPAYFEETLFTQATFRGVHFFKSAVFNKAKTYEEFLWQGTQCDGPISFDFATLHGRTSFSNMIFAGPVSCYRSNFKGSVWFLGTKFQDVSFVNTCFEAEVYFSFDRNTLRERNRRRRSNQQREQTLQYVSLFEGAAKFTNTMFYKKTVFENVFFKKIADFENACFAEEINFQNAHFQAGASFKGSFCTQELDFSKAVFDDYVNFDLANINRRLNLTDTAFDKGISFYHAVIDVVVVEHEQIKGRLVYEGRVPGYEEKKHLMRVKEEYLILKESFNQRGKFGEEDWAYYRYRVNDRKSHTQKALRSLLGKPILAVQDDVPAEEQEDDNKLIEMTDKSIERIKKAIIGYQNRIEKKSGASGDPGKREKEVEELTEKLHDEEKSLVRTEQERTDVVTVVALNQTRKQKLHESRDKSYSFVEALQWLFKNALWKLVDFGTGYGVKPFRIGLLAAAVILCFASIYFTSGVQFAHLNSFWDWVYFSAMTFATASPEGDLFYSETIKFFIMTESLLGVFLMALFVGCYTRKIMR